MKIKESEQLKRLATASGQTPNKVSETIVTELINKGIIEDISDNWGLSCCRLLRTGRYN